jgi:STE24 endopeptidase
MFLSFALILTALFLVRVPFSIYSGFFRNSAFNLMRADFATWSLRFLGSSLISITVNALIFTGFAYGVRRLRRPALMLPLFLFAAGLALTVLYPRIVTPLFFKTRPVEDYALLKKINALLHRAGVEVKRIEFINAGAYSATANAYMVGFGRERRIVLYDTLRERFTDDEITAILAHELCHYREEHGLIGLLIAAASFVLIIPGLRLFSRKVLGRDLNEILEPRNHAAFMLLLTALLFISTPFTNAVSRVMERRADAYAASLIDDPQVLQSLEVTISRTNKAHLLPHPFFVWFYHSHPPVWERIRAAQETPAGRSR